MDNHNQLRTIKNRWTPQPTNNYVTITNGQPKPAKNYKNKWTPKPTNN